MKLCDICNITLRLRFLAHHSLQVGVLGASVNSVTKKNLAHFHIFRDRLRARSNFFPKLQTHTWKGKKTRNQNSF